VTRIAPDDATTLPELLVKSHVRVFFERVPLPAEARSEVVLSDPWDYAVLAEGVEAWGFRAMQEQREPLDRRETALLWLENEYRPVIAMLREADLIQDCTDAEAYIRITAERWRLLRTHRWEDDVLQRVIEDGKRGSRRG
jgi:hypothetical protein